jgi:cobalt-zinc-cadmium efflux system membrane fusion protein
MDDATRIRPPLTRELPAQRQMVLLAIVSVTVIALLFGLPMLGRLFASRPAPAPGAPPPGTFRVTGDQWRALKIADARTTAFRPGVETEGKIATNDDRTTQVYSPYSGRVTRVFAKIGDVVHAGQPLFAIDAAEFVQGQNDLAAAHAQLTLTRAAETRLHALYDINGAALKDWQQSQTDLSNAETTLAAVRNRLRILGKSDAEITALENRPLGQGISAETIVSSPIDGVVIQRTIGAGQNLGSVTNGGSTPAFQVSDLSTVWLVGDLREVDSPQAKIGQPIEVRVTALPDRVFTAKVDYVSPTVDPVTRRVMVRAAIANTDGALKPEMFASFSLITGAESDAVGVPEEAVIYEGDTARVWVARSGGLLELRNIHTGETQNGLVEVTAGLAPNDRVVTSGALFIDRASKSD